MSKFAHFRDFSRDEIVETSYQVIALLRLCEATAWVLNENGPPVHQQRASAMHEALKLALELQGLVHDTIEMQEG